jgi:hypothetical protein
MLSRCGNVAYEARVCKPNVPILGDRVLLSQFAQAAIELSQPLALLPLQQIDTKRLLLTTF